MKKFLVIVLIAMLSACKQDSDVKVIPILDNVYLKPNQVDKKLDPDKIGVSIKDFEKEIDMKTLFEKYGRGEHIFFFNFLVNEKGTIDYIRPKLVEYDFMANQLLPLVKKWEFNPAEKNGKAVKSQTNFGVKINFDESGKYKADFAFTTSYGSKLSFMQDGFSENDSGEYFVAVEEMPAPIGGLKAIQEKIKYPKEAKDRGIEGRVFVKALINEKGEVDAVEILKGIGYGCDEAAAEAVKNTKFTPGRQRGVPQKVQVSVPILFMLNSGSEYSGNITRYEAGFDEVKTEDINNSNLNEIKGKIIYKNEDNPIVGVNIKLFGVNIGAASDPNGEYVIKNIPPGKYNLEVNHPKYGQHKSQLLYLNPGKSYTINIYVVGKL